MYWDPSNIESFMKAFDYECTKSTSFHLFKQIDVSGDGRIEFEDFFEFITSTRPIINNDAKLRDIFYKFSNGKEYLNEEDMVRICRDNNINITEEQAIQMFYKVSPANDPQKISLSDFKKLVQKSSGDRMKLI